MNPPQKSRLFTRLVTEIALCGKLRESGRPRIGSQRGVKKASLFTRLVTEIVPFRISRACHRDRLEGAPFKKISLFTKPVTEIVSIPAPAGRVPEPNPGHGLRTALFTKLVTEIVSTCLLSAALVFLSGETSEVLPPTQKSALAIAAPWARFGTARRRRFERSPSIGFFLTSPSQFT